MALMELNCFVGPNHKEVPFVGP